MGAVYYLLGIQQDLRIKYTFQRIHMLQKGRSVVSVLFSKFKDANAGIIFVCSVVSFWVTFMIF